MRRRLPVRRLLAATAFFFTSLFVSACADFSSPQNTFAPDGDVAQQQRRDFLLVMWPALVIGVLVLLALPLIMVMFRRKKDDPGLPKQIHGNTPLELTWTILPAILLAVTAVPTLAGIQHLAERPPKEALTVHVIGVQWAWQFEYPKITDSSQQPLLTTAEMYIPTKEKIDIQITSNDVNHSFWVPKLAGKTDAINNHPNHMWIQADKPGTYEGQCAEFCGLSHAQMRFRVIALDRADFDQWVADQGGTVTDGASATRAGVAPSGE